MASVKVLLCGKGLRREEGREVLRRAIVARNCSGRSDGGGTDADAGVGLWSGGWQDVVKGISMSEGAIMGKWAVEKT